MTIADILDQTRLLNFQERKELVKLLIDSFDLTDSPPQAKTGAEIVAMLQDMEAVEFVDPHIEDPIEWVKAQRAKRAHPNLQIGNLAT